MTKRYPGELGKPSLPPPERVRPGQQVLLGREAAALAIKAAEARNLETFVRHHARGMKLLLEHYEINPADHANGSEYQALALMLAIDNVEYFKPRLKKRGQDKYPKACLLEVDIALRRCAGDKNDAVALRYLAMKQSPWNRKSRARDAADPADHWASMRRQHKNDPAIKEVREVMEFARSKGAQGKAVLEELRISSLR